MFFFVFFKNLFLIDLFVLKKRENTKILTARILRGHPQIVVFRAQTISRLIVSLQRNLPFNCLTEDLLHFFVIQRVRQRI